MQRGTKGFVGEVQFPESWGEFVYSAVGVIAQTLQDVYQIVIGVDEFQDSGLSRQKFCASRGISLPRLTRWMAFFRRESPSPTLSPFVDLGAVNQSASVSGPHVELVLDLGDGIVMTLRRAS